MTRPYPSPLPNELAGKRALVTGGSRGIGAATAQLFIDSGAKVVTTARNRHDELPADSIFIAGDIRTAAGADELVRASVEALGGIDILINNAGATRVFPGGASSIPDEEWQDSIDINFLSAVRVTLAAIPFLKESGSSSIVNISSTSAFDGGPIALHYGTAKAALNLFTKGMSKELAPQGIRVNTITPGSIVTPGGTEVLQDIANAFGATIEALTSGIPLGRRGEPRDIAEMVSFLVSDRSQWITGANFLVDGGFMP